MRKLGIALLLGFLTGSALAISVGIEQSLTAETRYIESQKAETAIHLTPQEAHDLIQTNRTNPHLVILDVRTPREFSQGHLENAINIDFYAETFRQDINQLDREKAYLIYCRRGVRSDLAGCSIVFLNVCCRRRSAGDGFGDCVRGMFLKVLRGWGEKLERLMLPLSASTPCEDWVVGIILRLSRAGELSNGMRLANGCWTACYK